MSKRQTVLDGFRSFSQITETEARGIMETLKGEWKAKLRLKDDRVFQALLGIHRALTATPTEPIRPQEAIHKRKWPRAAVKSKLHVNDFSASMLTNYPVLSLSAGGCLVDGLDLPREFQFSLELPTKTIWGTARVSYTTEDRKSGVCFTQLEAVDESLIQNEVKRAFYS